MNAKYDLSAFGPDIVYVKAVATDSLPQAVRDQVQGLDHVFAVHDTAGVQLALVADQKLAFALARQHDKVPVTVH